MHTVLRPELNETQLRVLGALREDGVAVVPFADLFPEELWDAALADIRPFVEAGAKAEAEAGKKPKKKNDLIVRRFFRKAMQADPSMLKTLKVDGPWLRIAASQQVLDVINSYRDEQTWIQYVDNWYTIPYPRAEKRIAAQKWHRDPEDQHVVKVFVYLSDVDEEAGPFEYVRGSASGLRYGELWPWEADGDFYPPQKELAAAIPANDRLALTGPAGTVIFADTSGFHRGGFTRSRARILATFTYIGGARSRETRRFKVDLAGRDETLPAQVRFALD
jgi:Phytanoyl-CoA dioxygenase (PhyH)